MSAVDLHNRLAVLVRALQDRRTEVGWTALFVAIAVVGLVTSRGEPVCGGPFITTVWLSLPPQCGSPVDALLDVSAVWALGLLLIVAARALAKRSRCDRVTGGLAAMGAPGSGPSPRHLWPHLFAAAALILVVASLVLVEYAGGDGSYACNSALHDFMGPRPIRWNSELFDAGPPCWDEAKSRIAIAAVLTPMMAAAWAARSVALAHKRPRGPVVAAFALLAIIGIYSGYVGGAG